MRYESEMQAGTATSSRAVSKELAESLLHVVRTQQSVSAAAEMAAIALSELQELWVTARGLSCHVAQEGGEEQRGQTGSVTYGGGREEEASASHQGVDSISFDVHLCSITAKSQQKQTQSALRFRFITERTRVCFCSA